MRRHERSGKCSQTSSNCSRVPTAGNRRRFGLGSTRTWTSGSTHGERMCVGPLGFVVGRSQNILGRAQRKCAQCDTPLLFTLEWKGGPRDFVAEWHRRKFWPSPSPSTIAIAIIAIAMAVSAYPRIAIARHNALTSSSQTARFRGPKTAAAASRACKFGV